MASPIIRAFSDAPTSLLGLPPQAMPEKNAVSQKFSQNADSRANRACTDPTAILRSEEALPA